MKRIQFVSSAFTGLFQLCFIFTIAAQIIGWVHAPIKANFLYVIPSMYVPFLPNSLSSHTKVLGFLITSIPMMMQLIVFYYLIKLFNHYKRYEIFTADAVRCIRNVGYALLANQLLALPSDFILGFILTANNPPGFRIASMTVSDSNIKVLLTSLIIILISWIMAEGNKLHEEQSLTI